ncbi:phosphatase PAP2 family protein [Microbacterium pumilum]
MEPARTSLRMSSRAAVFVVGGLLIAASCLLGAWIFIRGVEPFAIDTWWNDVLAAWVSPFMLGFSQVMNFLGGGWFGTLAVPLGGAVALILVKRPWSAAYFLTAETATAGCVQLLKHAFGRARPEDIIVVSDYGSYPSGHVANATTIAVAAVTLFPRLWVAVVGATWVLLMALSRTYLHAHWLSDTLGGMLVGAGTALVVAGFFATVIARERVDAAPAPPSLG